MGLPLIGAIAQIQNMPGFRSAVREVNSSLAGIGKGVADVAAGSEEGGIALEALAGVGMAAVTAAAAAAVAGILAVATASAALVAHGVQVNASLERTAIQLEGLTGLGQENLAWAREMSVTTPFTTESVTNALQMAYAYGFQGSQAKALVQATADVSAAFGDQGDRMHRILIALGQMHGAQKVNAQDMKQLTEAGIDAWSILAEAAGTSVSDIREQVSEGMVAADWAVGVFTEAMQEKFGGASERASDSLLGIVGNIKNILDLVSADVSLPLFEKFRDVLAGIRDYLLGSDFQNAVDDFSAFVAEIAAGIDVGAIVGAFEDIISFAMDAVNAVRDLVDVLRGLSGADILANTTRSIELNTAAMENSLDRMAAAHADVISGMRDEMSDAAGVMQSSLGAIADKYADKADSLNRRMAKSATDFANRMRKLDRDLGRDLTDNQEKLQEKLTSLAETHADRKARIEEDLADEIYDYNTKLEDMRTTLSDKIYDIQESYGEKREDLQERLAAAETDTEKEKIRELMAELDAKERREVEKLQEKERRQEERLQRDHDREMEALRKKAEAEDAEYAKDVAKAEERSAKERERLQEDHAFAVEDLKQKHAEESGEIAAQMAKLDTQRAAEEAAVKDSYNSQVQALKDRIAAENAAYEEQRQKLIDDTEAENERLKEMGDERAASRDEATDKRPWMEYWTLLKGLFVSVGGLTRELGETWRGFGESVTDLLHALGLDWEDLGRLVGGELMLMLRIGLAWSKGFIRYLTNLVDGLTLMVQGFDQLIHRDLTGLLTILEGLWQATFGGMIDTVSGFVRDVKGAFNDLADSLVGHSIVPDMVDSIQSVFNDPDWLSIGRNVTQQIGQGVAQGAISAAAQTSVVAPEMMQFAPAGGSPVIVQQGETTYDNRINVNANYAKTQDPATIRQDMRLATMLQR